jgi:anti-sigma-K factor RskA
MNKQNEKWLDEQLKKTIDSGKVNFDSEKWKQKYSAEYQMLVSRTGQRPNVQRFLWVRSLVRVAAIVAVIALVLFLIPRLPSKRVEPTVATFVEDRSPAKVLSVLSLSMAYRQGGLDAVDEQCKKAFELLGQKNTTISIGELLNENNGKKPERKNL